MDKTHYDLIIIGGGAAGMMAAISAKKHHPEYSVAILDRTFALGRKILVCGAGRCNITNINLDKSIEKHYYGANPEFIKSIFDQFSYKDIVSFFNDLGIELYVERKTDIGKLFPITNQASTVTEVMLDEINRLGIDVYLNTEVVDVHPSISLRMTQRESKKNDDGKALTANSFSVETTNLTNHEKQTFTSSYLILSAGGRTYPALGSDGSGYSLAESFGHKIITPVPAALPLEAKSQLCHYLQGVKLELEVTSFIDNKKIKTSTDEVMFTKYGLSGPAILNISREISIRFNREHKDDCHVTLNFFPKKSENELENFLNKRWGKRPEQAIEKSLFGLFPNKVATSILNILKIPTDKKVKLLNEKERKALYTIFTSAKIPIVTTRGWNEAEFTAGGIDTSEVTASTLESRLVNNLFLCGEILDVDGDVGGFNLSWSWSSGWVAGKLN